jgi:hypothetical protein
MIRIIRRKKIDLVRFEWDDDQFLRHRLDLFLVDPFASSFNPENFRGSNGCGGLPSPHSLCTRTAKTDPGSCFLSVLNKSNGSSSAEGLNVS